MLGVILILLAKLDDQFGLVVADEVFVSSVFESLVMFVLSLSVLVVFVSPLLFPLFSLFPITLISLRL